MPSYQATFAAGLLHSGTTTPQGIRSFRGGTRDSRFAVYRNNVVAGLIAALESRFPVVLRLVGSEFFRSMAQLYIALDPPRSPILFRYGSTFPTFIETFPPAAALPYLADVAQLEYARGIAYHAADAAPLPARSFTGLGEDELAATGLDLHPSVTLLSSRFPAVSIWEAHHGEAEPVLASWASEDALIARPHLDVEVRQLPPGGYVFLRELSAGSSFAEAAAIAAADVLDFDAAANFALLIQARIGVRFLRVHAADARRALD